MTPPATANVPAQDAANAAVPPPPTGKSEVKKRYFKKTPSNADRSKLPQPKKLSTVQTTLTNDPLWQEAFVIEGETGLTNQKAAQEFDADAAGYITVVEEEYRAIADNDKHYAKCVTASAHAYYHHIMLWYKYALVAQKHGVAHPDQERLVHFVQGYDSVVAAGAGTYLAGLGDYEDATGVKHLLTARLPNANGHFGRATRGTHSDYEHYPAPAISLQRVLEDVATAQRGYERHQTWDIQALRPAEGLEPPQAEDLPPEVVARNARQAQRRREEQGDEEGEDSGDEEFNDAEDAEPEPANLPTANLLGWRPATTLVKNQLAELKSIFPEEEVFDEVHRDINRFALVRGLFEMVYRKLRECKRYKIVPTPLNTTGSLAQQATWAPEEPVMSRFKQAVSAEGRILSRTMIPMRIAVAAKVMAYRCLRRNYDDEREHEVRPWSCYHYQNYSQVPDNWSANRNASANRGTDGLIAYAPFSSVVSSRHDAIVEFLNKFKAN